MNNLTQQIGYLLKVTIIGLLFITTLHAQGLPVKRVESFKLDQVTLLPGPFKRAMDRKCRYLLFLDNNRLLYSFRANCKLSTMGAAQYGGWESMAIKGHTAGHVLSALAQAYQSTGDVRYKAKADSLVIELQKCQNAAVAAGFGAGYLAAIPESDVNTLLNLGNIWAPLYNIHKTFAGLLDCHELLGNTTALDMAKKLGDWSYTKLSTYNHEKFQQFWNNRQSAAGEFGGYNESLAELYRITGTEKYLTAAHFFDHDKLFNPCLANKDSLNGLHANTSIPEIIGALKIYEASGDANSYKIAQQFYDIVIDHHTYINGGNSQNEYFRAPDAIASQLTDDNCETCNVYNMLKLARRLFFFNPLPKYMDYYERALYNQILASQDTTSENGHCTYFQPMRSGGIKTYQSDLNDFKCCDGTGLENHTRYGGDIFFYSGDTLFVNLFIPAELNWVDKNKKVKLETSYPHSDTVRLTIKGSGNMPLKIRAPFWLEKPVLAAIDNASLQPVAAVAGTYLTLNGAWDDSSVVTIVLPQTIRFEKAPDKANVGGVMYGAQVLAGAYGTTNLTAMPTLDASTVKRTSPSLLQFSATASTGAVALLPFYQMHQRYSIYWNLNNIPVTSVAPVATSAEPQFGITRITRTPSRIVVDFSANTPHTSPIVVALYTLNGALVGHSTQMLRAGDRQLVLDISKTSMSQNMLMCTIDTEKQSVTRMIGCVQ